LTFDPAEASKKYSIAIWGSIVQRGAEYKGMLKVEVSITDVVQDIERDPYSISLAIGD